MQIRLTDDVLCDKLLKYEAKTLFKSPLTIDAFFFYSMFLLYLVL